MMHQADEATPLAPSNQTLRACGFTPAQATAVVELVHETTATAAEALRQELSKWHCYLAVYLLCQIGIVLLAILLIEAIRDPYPRKNASWGSCRQGTHDRVSLAIQGKQPVNLPRFEVIQRGTQAGSGKNWPRPIHAKLRLTFRQAFGITAIRRASINLEMGDVWRSRHGCPGAGHPDALKICQRTAA